MSLRIKGTCPVLAKNKIASSQLCCNRCSMLYCVHVLESAVVLYLQERMYPESKIHLKFHSKLGKREHCFVKKLGSAELSIFSIYNGYIYTY